MKCILHIGAEKTGSTSLQHWLYSNRGELAEHGFYLSDSLDSPNNRLLPIFFQSRIDAWTKSNGVEDQSKKREFLTPSLQSFCDEVRLAEDGYHTFLITSEHLHSRLDSQELVKELHKFLDPLFESINVVGYVRNQADLILSSYSTALRASETSFLSEVVEQVSPDEHYYNHLLSADLWSNVFGRSAVTFQVYDHCVNLPGGVVTDFAKHILKLPELSDQLAPSKRLNSGLSPFQAAAFRQINSLFPRWPVGSPSGNWNRKLKQLVTDLPVTTNCTLRIADPQQVLRRFESENQLFFEKYGDGINHFSPEKYTSMPLAGSIAFEEDPDLDAMIKALLEKISLESNVPNTSLWQRLQFWNKKL